MEQQNSVALGIKSTTNLQKWNLPSFPFFFSTPLPAPLFLDQKKKATLSKAAGRTVRETQGQVTKESFPNITVSISVEVHMMK